MALTKQIRPNDQAYQHAYEHTMCRIKEIQQFKELMKALPKYINNEQKKIKTIDYGSSIYNLYNDFEKINKNKERDIKNNLKMFKEMLKLDTSE